MAGSTLTERKAKGKPVEVKRPKSVIGKKIIKADRLVRG